MSYQQPPGSGPRMFTAGCTMNIGWKKLPREITWRFCGVQARIYIEEMLAPHLPLLLKLRLDRRQRFLKRRSRFINGNLPNDTCSSSKLLGGRESLGFVSWRLGVRAFDHTQTMRQCDHPGSSGSAEKEQGSAEPARVGRSAGEESLCLCCHGITMVQTANSRSRLNPTSLAQSHSDGAALWRVLGEP